MITQEQFLKNYESVKEPHDTRVKAIVAAKNDARTLMGYCGGSFESTAKDINVLNFPNSPSRYLSDDELIEITTKES